jgi:WD40 repeat protein
VSRQVLWRDLTKGADYVRPMCFDAGGNKLLTHSSDDVYHEWDVNTGLEAQSWPGPMPTDGAIALSQQFCVAGGVEGEVASRNLTEKNIILLPLETLEPGNAAFSPEGKFFAVLSSLGYVKIWSTKTWKEVVTLRGFVLGVHSVAFSPDGKRMATGGGAGAQALRLWDTDDWQNVITLQNADSFFLRPLFSLDGNSVGTLSYAGILHVWRAPSWEEINAAKAKEKATGRKDKAAE